MSRKDMSITVRNLTDKQYSWLEKEMEQTGNSLSTIVRILIQKAMEKVSKQEGPLF